MDFLDFVRKVAEERKAKGLVIKGGKGSGWYAPPKGTHRAGAKAGKKGRAKNKVGKRGNQAFQRGANAIKGSSPGAFALTRGAFNLDKVIERLGPMMAPRTAGLERFTGRVNEREKLSAARKAYDMAAAEIGARTQAGKKVPSLVSIRRKLAQLYDVSPISLEE